MNKAGRDFCEKWAREFKKTCAKSPPKNDLFSISRMIERSMRLGIEARAFELETHPSDPFKMTDDIERVVIATLKQDYVKYHGA